MQNLIVQALGKATRNRGSSPQLTWYQPSSGARTELSARTLANWVDKTANLLIDLDAVSCEVRGEVSRDHPGHWMSLLWPLAAWQAGCSYWVVDSASAKIRVVGPSTPALDPARITIACSLHPLGVGLRDLPAGVLDFSSEALAQSDQRYALEVEPDEPAWVETTKTRSHRELLVRPVSERVLVRPSGAWQTLVEAILAPLLGGGSAVVVDGEIDPEALARLTLAERITPQVA